MLIDSVRKEFRKSKGLFCFILSEVSQTTGDVSND